MSHRQPIAPVVEEVIVYSYPKFIYFWPLIVSGFLLALIDLAVDVPRIFGIIWLIALVWPALTTGIDIPRNVAIFFGVLFLLFLAVVYIGSLLHVSFAWFANFMTSTCPRFQRETAFWASMCLALPYLVMLIYARFDSKWTINPNRVQHRSWAVGESTIPMGQYKARSEYNDVLELLLLGAGDIVIFAPLEDNRVVERIKNIPRLWWRWGEINELLEETRTRDPRSVIPVE